MSSNQPMLEKDGPQLVEDGEGRVETVSGG